MANPDGSDKPERPNTARQGPLEVGQVVGGRYRVEAALRRGGMGAIYVVKHLRVGREFVLKALLPDLQTRPELIQRFEAEARAAGAIRHPGIVGIVDFDHEDGLDYLVMEKLEGEDLADRIARAGALPVDLVVRIGIETADAISAAHAHRPKIIHRDLKPQNVFLAVEGKRVDVVKVLDFGIAKLVEPEALMQSLTSTGEVCGTPLYMSPEQLRNAKDVDERTDVYAIGVILYQALTGKPPFVGESFPDLVLQVATGTPPSLASQRADLPPALVATVERAMAREREQRFASAGELRDALVAIAEGRAPILPPAEADAPAPPKRRAIVVAGATALAAGAAGFFLLRGDESPPPSRVLVVPPPGPDAAPAPATGTAAAAPAPLTPAGRAPPRDQADAGTGKPAAPPPRPRRKKEEALPLWPR